MKKENVFYLLCIFTVLIVRTGVFLFPANKIIVLGTVIHHFWIGLAIIIVIFLFLRRYWIFRTIFLPIGLGLFADEFFYIIFGAGPVFPNYWSWYSLGGAVFFCALIFGYRKRILAKIYKR